MGDRAIWYFVNDNRTTEMIPSSTDIVLLWAKFTSHSKRDQCKSFCKDKLKNAIFIEHFGGISTMCQVLEQAIAKCIGAQPLSTSLVP